MIAICNGTTLTDYVGQGYTYSREPQYGTSMTALNGYDYTAKLRDRVHLTVPFIPVTQEKLTEILQLFPAGGAYVYWTYYDPYAEDTITLQMKYDARTASLQSVVLDGTEYYSGLVVDLLER